MHDSRFEAEYCNRLLVMKQKGEVQEYKVQVKFELAKGINHIIDFFVWRWENGKIIQEVHETKGVWTAVARLKKKLFEERYPYLPYIVIYKTKRRVRCRKKIKVLILKRVKVYR